LEAGRAIEVVAMITASTGFLCWLAPAWLTVALPGLLVTLAANPHTPTVGITGHYLFPILPWVFAAAAIGAGRLQRTRPDVLRVISVLLLLGTIADSPLWRTISGVSADERAAAAEIRSSLRRIPLNAPVLAMPNLVPHLSHRDQIWTLGGSYPRDTATHIVISPVGSLWPFDAEGVRAEIERYQSDQRFTTVMAGPLYVFQRVQQ
jgi:uncharacterized membrane protein